MDIIPLSLVAWIFDLAGSFARIRAQDNNRSILQATDDVIDSDNMSCIVMHLSGYLGFWHLQCATSHSCARAKCLLNETSVAKDASSSTDRSFSFASIGRFLFPFK